jgi:uracil-DNA glycosylase
VPSFGGFDAGILVVGLAPGLKGANRTGRPFTGDYAGLVLYSSLKKSGFATGEYDPEKVAKQARGNRQEASKGPFTHASCLMPSSGDGFRLLNCRITNAVRCVPPENKPVPQEIKQCNNFLKSEITAMPHLKVILTLGLISHKAVLMALGLKQSAYKFGHAAEHLISRGNASPDFAPRNLPRGVVVKNSSAVPTPPLILLNSYHCSRYNINTGVLTQAMFDKIVERARGLAALA